MASIHRELHARSLQDPEGFWGIAAEAIHWDRRFEKVLDESRAPLCAWFAGGLLNTCYNALDIHIERGRRAPDRLAASVVAPRAGRPPPA